MLLAGPVLAQAPLPEGQCLMLPLEPARRAQQSGLVVEAQVLDAQSFWDASHTHLFTKHRLRVFSLLKGQVADTSGLVVITEGGRLGLDQHVLSNTLRLATGQVGVFFLARAPWPGLPLAGGRGWTPYGSEQGFIEYDLAERTASEPFRTYSSIDGAFFREVSRFTGQARRVLQASPAEAAATVPQQRGTLAPTVSNFTPQTLPAGAEAVLTINGDGFGATRGSGFVEFRNADDGGATRVRARERDYVSWTNTRIQVRVPSSANGGQPASNGHPAGSGPIRVTTNDQLSNESAGSVTINYALTNVESTDGNFLQRPNHIALNSTGGITFRFSPNFTANAAAVAAKQRAINTWRCQTGVNWEVGPAFTTNAIADDNQNVVAFDVGTQLPDRVLGRTTSYYRGCLDGAGGVIFWVKEIDMQYDDAAIFQFGPAPPVGTLNQIDFETVAVHELGHAQQLSHLILPGAVMHYAIGRGQNTRTLNPASDVVGGRQVLRMRSFKSFSCSGGNPATPPMLPAPLISFSAQFERGAGVIVSWATRDECFVTNFAIERSQGGDTTSWTRVGTVNTRPPSNTYQFFDGQVPAGLFYYRLRLTRPDGSLDSVTPVVLTTEGANATVSLFPNPIVRGQPVRLQYPAATEGAVVFRFFDSLGRRILTQSLGTTAGLNILSLNVDALPPGFYVLTWQDTQGKTGSLKAVRL
ncbi:IPT/TIG domain-containing protein [Hymenobacter arizonensis]|uniref:Por secretion system C-terminal sorting domain-containing protein n=1 Tax=Hymenobacter arizonensis TaxID=1227077 RepID=A0A1I6A8U4_HYMAR|nr:IPT/TIG domain-containing protein [Hymenobacter arizonensis]SFQ65156.1 Por secretion system C-terminal sorting domain-containing protein [Hymenobacter arizonensis]